MNLDQPAGRFALRLLRDHPQISYQHALSAAEYAGLEGLPSPVFFAAVDQLGIVRQDRGERTPSAGDSAVLLVQLERLLEECRYASELRDVLLQIRAVTRAALETPNGRAAAAEQS